MKSLALAVLAATAAAGAAAATSVPLLDRSFGQDGVLLVTPVNPPPTAAAGLRAARVGTDGSIFLAGSEHGPDGQTRPYVAKLLPNGQPDPGFGSGGRFVFALAPALYPYGASLGDIALLGDGRIVFASGVLLDISGVSATTLLGVLTPFGQLDPSFAGVGYRRFDYAASGAQPAALTYNGQLAVDASDRILLSAPTGAPAAAVARFLPDGALDPAYGAAGIAWLPASTSLGRLLLDDTDALLVAGVEKPVNAPGRLAVARLLSNGALDLGFGGGLATMEVAASASDFPQVGSLARDRTGRILVGHAVISLTSTSFSLDAARFTTAGQLDPRFNAQQQQPGHPGLVRIANDAVWMAGTFAFPTADRRIVVLGSSYRVAGAAGLAFARLREDASSDPSLPAGPDGPAHLMPVLGRSGNDDGVIDADPDPQGRLVVAGQTHGPLGDCYFVMRLIGDRLFADGHEPAARPMQCPSP